ncbi:alpha/beta hydrolase [Catellatospora methionotrophica]|uniref:alpha/beta hydrolase n=1 Tax=Catellatospora methionotrophica TaxID=121620 RepID=UPI0033C058F3
MRAREADADGFAEHDGVRIHYEVYGDGEVTLLLMPAWTVIDKRFWKAQVPYLSRHHRVVVYDGPGNGRSDRPLGPAAYGQDPQVAYALKVLDATGTARAVPVALSMAANWALALAADHPDRVLGTVLIGPTVSIASPPDSPRAAFNRVDGPAPAIAPSRVPVLGEDPAEGWLKYNREYWKQDYDDFLWFFFGQCFPEPHSTKQIEDAVGWGRQTAPEVLIAKSHAPWPDNRTLTGWCERIKSPLLLIHGDDDRISPVHRSRVLAELTGAELVTVAGAGHIPLARDPVQVNLLLHRFASRLRAPASQRRTWSRFGHRRKRVLYLSSPIGLGHARRDVAIAEQLRLRHPDVRIDWLAQHPVTRVLEQAGERVHPASRWLANESAHIESEAGEHDLHCFEALRRMDEVLVANFMVFHDVVRETDYDLVVGDEAWDVDHFLHENPELKRFAYAWFTDFVGFLPMPDGRPREALVAADYNAEMIEHIARYPRIRDRAVFVGDPDDVVDGRFGPDLPMIREWTREHYDFAGYVTGFDPGTVADRAALRAELGYRPDERVCVVTVGGSGVGHHLLRRVADAHREAARLVPGLRMLVVTGPRIDPSAVPAADGLDVRAYVPDLHRHLAASDLAVVQGGLTTCMELTAARRPFIYVPLRHHFEQNFHVAHRLRRHGAGRRLDYDDLTPETLAHAIAAEIGREVDYRPVHGDGAARAAGMLAELL